MRFQDNTPIYPLFSTEDYSVLKKNVCNLFAFLRKYYYYYYSWSSWAVVVFENWDVFRHANEV